MAVLALKAVDVTARIGVELGGLWLATALLAYRVRTANLAVAVVALVTWNIHGGAHTVAMFWVAVTLAVVREDDLPRMLSVTAGTVYLFAGLNKLPSEPFMQGEIIAHGWIGLPALPALAVAAVATEVLLAGLVWMRHRAAVPLAIALHCGILLAMPQHLLDGVRLVAFNVLLLTLVLYAVPRPISLRR